MEVELRKRKPQYVTSKTPMRISFAGGGTDLPSFYRYHGGGVVSSAINRYVYVTVKRHSGLFGEKYRLNYSTSEQVNNLDDIHNGIARECIRLVGFDDPLYIATVSDVPTSSGLGSSSSFTVGLLHALHTINGREVSPFQLAEEASFVEIEALGNPIGKQDQYAAAFGGLNHFNFEIDDRVLVDGIYSENGFIERVFDNLLLVWTGIQRNASDILSDQSSKVESKINYYHALNNLVLKCKAEFLKKEENSLANIGQILETSWKLKKELSDLTASSEADSIYEALKEWGSSGGKLAGAGGGGFVIAMIDSEKHSDIIGLFGSEKVLRVRNEPRGSQISSLSF